MIGAGQAVGEAGAVVDIGGEPGVQRQIGGEAGVERVALVVVDRGVIGTEVAGGVGGIAAGEAADDVAALLGDLVGVGEVELAEAGKLRRAERHLPGADQRAIDGDGEVDVRLADVGVVKEVVDAVFEIVDVERPARARGSECRTGALRRARRAGDEGVFARAGWWRS